MIHRETSASWRSRL